MKKIGALIMRAQPFHAGHLNIVRQAAGELDHVKIILGSMNMAPSIRNPFSFEQRASMINAALQAENIDNASIHPLRDYFYSNEAWIADVQQIVTSGNEKDNYFLIVLIRTRQLII